MGRHAVEPVSTLAECDVVAIVGGSTVVAVTVAGVTVGALSGCGGTIVGGTAVVTVAAARGSHKCDRKQQRD